MGPIRATARITSRGEKLEEREGASLVTFPDSFIFIVHVYSTVLVCIFSTVVQSSFIDHEVPTQDSACSDPGG